MAETANLGLPMLAPSQAQKHVTVNEALTRLDALAKGVLASRSVAVPPEGPDEGAVWAVPTGATDEWTGRDGALAIATGGGWDFVAPREGWRAWALDEGAALRHDGARWAREQPPAGALGASGAATALEVVEFEHAVRAGVFSDTADVIPRNAVVFGVTGRVIEEITGTVTSWKLGNREPGTRERFGENLGTQVGSYIEGVLNPALTYYTPAPLRMTAPDGEFRGGRLLLAVHMLRLTRPSG